MIFTPKHYNTYKELRAERYDRLDRSNTKTVTECSDGKEYLVGVFGWVGNEVFGVAIEGDLDTTYVISNPFPTGLEYKNLEVDGSDIDLCWSIIAEARLG